MPKFSENEFMKVEINRESYFHTEVIGTLRVYDPFSTSTNYTGDTVFECKTLELPWLDNIKFRSCIPTGVYWVEKRWSWKFKNHFHILDVPNRTWILIHAGNFYTQTSGCILVGDDLTYINRDKYIDIYNSRKTLKKLYKLLPQSFKLTIQQDIQHRK